METYTYAPLNLDEPAFRLIRLFGGSGLPLQCELVHALLTPKDVMDYEAVSYTWGHSAPSTFHIEVHGAVVKTLTISPNVYHLLIDLRYPHEDRILWIDAICIDQNPKDTAERNHQVQQMAKIYGQARRVVVWLGTSTHEMDLAMKSLIELQIFYKDMKWMPQDVQIISAWKSIQKESFQDQNGPIYSGIKQIFDQPWFRRVWILQEVRNAQRASIYCGKHSVSSALFCSAPILFGIDVDPHCQAVLDLMPGSQARLDNQLPHRDFWTLLRQFRKAQATVEHDHIYALLGLAPKEQFLTVSYQRPISEVISEVVSYICRYDVAGLPLYSSISEFQADLDILHERVLERLSRKGYASNWEDVSIGKISLGSMVTASRQQRI